MNVVARPDPAAVGKAAEESFNAGLYCAESVLLAVARAQGIESALLPKIATGFCGGMSRTCGPCGALTGGVMAIGLVLGRDDGKEPAQRCYEPIQKLVRDFEREFGARDCDELLGCDLGTPRGQVIFRVKGLRERCVRYTGRAAEMAARLIAEAQERRGAA
ncbi:MAG TPA: C-GCAxxG-C-C family protein [Usitatibacter sp.]|nr:C-GCAxxG-C-C family protein [Usitatibacter sp.]